MGVVERAVEPRRLRLPSDLPQEHRRGAQDGGRVRVVSLSLSDQARRRAVYGIEHRIARTDIGATRRSNAALQLRRLVGQDVAVQIGQEEDLKTAACRRIDQIGRHNIHIPILDLDLRIVLCDRMAQHGEFSVRLLLTSRISTKASKLQSNCKFFMICSRIGESVK